MGIAGLVAVAALAIAPAGARGVAYEPAPAFCNEVVLRDYAAPFDRMPRLATPGREGRTGLGFRNLALVRYANPEPHLPGSGEIGYVLQQLRNAPPARPRWDVTVTLSRVDRDGRPVERVDRRTWRVRWVDNPKDLELPVPRRTGLYRIAAALTAPSGRQLRSYGYYFRVAKPIRSARLGLNAASYRPGQSVFGRVENFGTVVALFGTPYRIERYDGAAWTPAPESPRIFTRPQLSASPGHSQNGCSTFPIPPSMPAGHYRMVKEIEFSTHTRGSRGRYQPATLIAEFDVLP